MIVLRNNYRLEERDYNFKQSFRRHVKNPLKYAGITARAMVDAARADIKGVDVKDLSPAAAKNWRKWDYVDVSQALKFQDRKEALMDKLDGILKKNKK